MPSDVCVFKRTEKKYRLTYEKKTRLLEVISSHFAPDPHGKSTIISLYLDTPDRLLIRNSIDETVYKEKLRLRGYSTPSQDTNVFLEIKKKYKGVVYKRRVSMTYKDALCYINLGIKPTESQIMSEIDYAMNYYRHPKPSTLIAYEREAYFAQDCPNLRITFDTNIRYRNSDLLMEHGAAGDIIIPENTLLMEIKTDGAMPIWLSHALDSLGIFPTKFSKYGTAYYDSVFPKIIQSKGESEYVCNF